jgi:hypothetical protein
MNPRIQFAYYALWMAHPLMQGAVAGVMYRRKLHRSFPIFFRYLLAQILIFAVVFPVFLMRSYAVFFYVYAASIGVSVAIGFKVIYEVFLDVFRPYHTLKDLGSVLFKWAGLVMLLVAGVVAAASSSSEQGPLLQAVMTGQRCVRVIQVGLIIFLLVFSKYLGVSRREHSFGIALGFGAFAGMELILVALRAGGYLTETIASMTNMAAYNVTILIWLGYALAKSPAREASASLLMSQRWDQSLTDLQHPATADSLIPMFEGMVDRAFSRTNSEPVSDNARTLVSHSMSSLSDGDDAFVSTPPRLTSKL